MVTVLGTSQEFEGCGWVTYDTSYRQQMVITGNRDWSQSNGSLFSKCFTARARLVERCELCLSSTHRARDCPGAVQDDNSIADCLRAIETAVATPLPTPKGTTRPKSLEVCQNFNHRPCFFRQCRYGMCAPTAVTTIQYWSAPCCRCHHCKLTPQGVAGMEVVGCLTDSSYVKKSMEQTCLHLVDYIWLFCWSIHDPDRVY